MTITAEGMAFARELNEICALPPGPEKEQRRKDWIRRMTAHFVRKKPGAVKDWQRLASGDPE